MKFNVDKAPTQPSFVHRRTTSFFTFLRSKFKVQQLSFYLLFMISICSLQISVWVPYVYTPFVIDCLTANSKTRILIPNPWNSLINESRQKHLNRPHPAQVKLKITVRCSFASKWHGNNCTQKEEWLHHRAPVLRFSRL